MGGLIFNPIFVDALPDATKSSRPTYDQSRREGVQDNISEQHTHTHKPYSKDYLKNMSGICNVTMCFHLPMTEMLCEQSYLYKVFIFTIISTTRDAISF